MLFSRCLSALFRWSSETVLLLLFEPEPGQSVRVGHREGRVQTKDEQDDFWRYLGVVNRSFKQTLPFGVILLLKVKIWGSAGRIREYFE